MSDNPNDPPPSPDGANPAESSPTARKRAAKKTAAKKTAIKKAAKKVAGKTAKKAAAKKAAHPPAAPPSAAPPPTPQAGERTFALALPAALPAEPSSPAPAPPEPREASANDGERQRFGRVAGGGPVAPRPIPPSPDPPSQQQAPPPHQPVPDTRDAPPGPVEPGAQRDARSKKRREKRNKRRREGGGGQSGQSGQREGYRDGKRDGFKPRNGNSPYQNGPRNGNDADYSDDQSDRRGITLSGPPIEVNGMLEIAPKGYAFLRVASKGFEQARDDIFVPPDFIRRLGLRPCQWIHGISQEGPRGPQLVEVTQVNGMTPEESRNLPFFDELKAVNPAKRISFETSQDRHTTRVLDLMAPVGRGQRGLIVSPPRSGKTTLLLHMAEAVRMKYEDNIHLILLLVDERPEEVTEFRRALPGAEIYASSNDDHARNHCRIAELAIERAKRLVEAGKDVFLLMDSITRLARAYNNTMHGLGRGTGSGGITVGALEAPRRLFAAARNTRGGGSLTILATALIQTNSRADEAIYLEFKGTGNMELILDRKIAENYIYPAVDIFKSGTRREELLLPEHMLDKIHLIRRGLSGHRPVEAMERLLFFVKKFPNNPQMLMEIKG